VASPTLSEWAHHSQTNSKWPLTHLRSQSLNASSTVKSSSRPRKPIFKSTSLSSLPTMIGLTTTPKRHLPSLISSSRNEDGTLSTLPDPRSKTTPLADECFIPNVHHPDLNDEVATLSNKLIHAINHQTNLDDTLSATRHELELARDKIKQLERENRMHNDLVSRGFLVRKSAMDSTQAKLAANVSEERKKRAEIEREKKNMEVELETLTTALFEEANKMVITARAEAQKELEIAQRKNEQLKTQLADTESLLVSHQYQLAGLKQVMEQMSDVNDDHTNSTSPSSPAFTKSYCKTYSTEDMEMTPVSSVQELVTPTYPTSFTHLIQTVLRTDLPAYDEFTNLIKTTKKLNTGNRISSGSYSGTESSINLGNHSGLVLTASANSPRPSPSIYTTSPATPITPMSSTTSNSTQNTGSSSSLKDSKFYKRILTEDIEPTLRLDSAPGLSWLARRTVLNSVCEGTLIVEPVPTPIDSLSRVCALCGESRKDPEYTRTHRFRTNSSENAQTYLLCKYCLGRIRSTCDLLGFLRILKDGYWRCDDEESERAAWDESIRLREQMFWCRVGGGVVPVMNHQQEFMKSSSITNSLIKDHEKDDYSVNLAVSSENLSPEMSASSCIQSCKNFFSEPEDNTEGQEAGRQSAQLAISLKPISLGWKREKSLRPNVEHNSRQFEVI
ncbi:BgTH12-04574, partial [Blumeria graminis f. sp. triticale]